MTTVIILAGGLGKRMNSDLPKVLHCVGNVPMIVRIIREANKMDPNRILIVVGKYREIIENVIQNSPNIPYEKIIYVDQSIPKGTGHAIMCCLRYIQPQQPILILSGDIPLIQTDTMRRMMGGLNDFCIMTTMMETPTGYGRLIKDSNNQYCIIEETDCNDIERECKAVNCGIYSTYGRILIDYLWLITNNNSKGEYYLTDLVGALRDHNISAQICEISEENKHEVITVNTETELNTVNTFI